MLPHKTYADARQRKRVWSRANEFAKSPLREIAIRQGEQEASLIAAKLTARGIAAVAEKRGETWIVRKERINEQA